MTAGLDPADLLPHRPPALAIDRVLSRSADEADALRVATEEDRWEGALIEGLAQTAALLVRADARAAPPLFVGLRDFVVRRRPRPGEVLRFSVRLERAALPLVRVHGVAAGDDPLPLAEGALSFHVGTAG